MCVFNKKTNDNDKSHSHPVLGSLIDVRWPSETGTTMDLYVVTRDRHILGGVFCMAYIRTSSGVATTYMVDFTRGCVQRSTHICRFQRAQSITSCVFALVGDLHSSIWVSPRQAHRSSSSLTIISLLNVLAIKSSKAICYCLHK